jgi:hypothetical protein
MNKLPRITVGVLAVLLLALATALPGLAQEVGSKPIVIPASHHDISAPLSEMVAHAPAPPTGGQRVQPERPMPPIPGAGAPPSPDLALQTQTLPLVGTVNGPNFAGISADGVAPPDTNGSVGDNVTNQYVQIVNEEYEVFNKTNGAVILGPTQVDVIWTGFTGACSASNGGDVNVLFDKAAARWVVGQLSNNFTSYCIAVSTSDDATGSYARYEFDFSPNIPDYPKLGVWPDAYYQTTNTFQNGSTFIGAMPCAYDRANMLTGGAANAICFQEGSSVASLLPSDLDGSTPPPAGEPNLYIELLSTTSLGLFKFHVDFNTPANSTFTGPTSIAVAGFSEACGGGGCIPQPPGDGTVLDSLGDRLMFRNAYRNLNGTEYLVFNHSVTAGSSVGVRWYQITNPNGTPTVAQQGTFAPDSNFRWMGSMAMDMAGDIAVGYSASSSSVHPAVRYSGRVPSDPAGALESEASIKEGGGSQTGGLSRWGDYSGMSIDPGDDCTFFYTTEYIPSDGSFNWATQIGSFKFVGCGSTTPDFSLSASPSSQTVAAGNSTSYTATVTSFNGFNSPVSLGVSGCPSNATCTLNPTSVTPPSNGSATSTLTVQTTSTTPGGTYTLTITGTSGSLVHNTSVTLVVVAPDFSISASTTSQTVKAGATAKFPLTLTPLNTFSGSVTLTVSGCPANSTCAFSPNPVTVTSPNSSASTFTVTTTKRTSPKSYAITITGTSGSLHHSTTVTLTVTKK